MRRWEQDRISQAGDSLGFFSIAPDFEGYFETLRKLAGEPAAGTTGRELPKFEKWWEDEFQTVVNARVGWWQSEMRKAQQALEDEEQCVGVSGAQTVAVAS